jgi:hypothetical protein
MIPTFFRIVLNQELGRFDRTHIVRNLPPVYSGIPRAGSVSGNAAGRTNVDREEKVGGPR